MIRMSTCYKSKKQQSRQFSTRGQLLLSTQYALLFLSFFLFFAFFPGGECKYFASANWIFSKNLNPTKFQPHIKKINLIYLNIKNELLMESSFFFSGGECKHFASAKWIFSKNLNPTKFKPHIKKINPIHLNIKN